VISKVLFTHVKQDESRNWFKFLGKQAGRQAVIRKGFPLFLTSWWLIAAALYKRLMAVPADVAWSWNAGWKT